MADLLDPSRINTEDYMRRLAQMFTYLQVLKGMGVSDSPKSVPPNMRMFDWNQRARWILPDADTKAYIRQAPGSVWPPDRETNIFGYPTEEGWQPPSFIQPGVIRNNQARRI